MCISVLVLDGWEWCCQICLLWRFEFLLNCNRQCADGWGSSQSERTKPTGSVHSQKKQAEQLKVGWSDGSKSPEKDLTSWALYPHHQGQMFQPWNMVSLNRLVSWGVPNGTPQISKRWESFFAEYADVFAKDHLDLGWTSVVKHKITLKEGAKPIKECYRRVPPGLYDEVWKHLPEMIDIEALWPSSSSWASVIVLVRKQNGKLHLHQFTEIEFSDG